MTLRRSPSFKQTQSFPAPLGMAFAAALTVSAHGQNTGSEPMVENFGNFAGETVDFLDVLQPSNGLFSAPVVSGNTLDFTNAISLSEFEANAFGGVLDTVSSSINAMVVARPGQRLDSFDVEVRVSGNLIDGGTDALDASTTAGLVASVVTRIQEVDGTILTGPTGEPEPFILAPIVVDLLTANGADNEGIFTLGGVLPISVAAAFNEQAGIAGDITSILWTIDLALEAQSQANTQSIINLDAFDSLTVTFAVPEPSSLLIIAPAATMLVRRRRRQC